MLKRLQRQPEAVRWRIAELITIVAAVILVAGWLLWLLPAQLAWVRSAEPVTPETAVAPVPTDEALTLKQLRQILGTQDQKP